VPEVLCLDCDPEFEAGLRAAGHTVHVGAMGYGRIGRLLTHPPHEADAIISNITSPVCFDMKTWGAGSGNLGDPEFVPLTDVTDEEIALPRRPMTVPGGPKTQPRYQLVYESQIESVHSSSVFRPHHITRAVERAGVPVLFLLNQKWIRHTKWFPNAIGLQWEIKRTSAGRIRRQGELERIFPEYTSLVQLPVRYHLTRGPFRDDPKLALTAQVAVCNEVGEEFGHVVRLGHGTVWAVPGCVDNLDFALRFLQRLKDVRGAGVPAAEPQLKALLLKPLGQALSGLPTPTVWHGSRAGGVG
jgi:hypothetical protein